MAAGSCCGARSNARLFAVLFTLAALPRLAALAVWPPSPVERYWSLSGSLLRDGSLAFGTVKTTAYEPLYPLILALLRLLLGDHLVLVRAAQGLIAASGAIALFLLTRALTGRARTAIVAAALYAGYPLLVRHAIGEDPYTLLSILLMAFAYAFVRIDGTRRAAIAGLWLGLALLTRMPVLPLVPLAATLLLVRDARRPHHAIALTLTALAVVSPLVIRNYTLNGSVLPNHGGTNLFIGNSPYSAALLPVYQPELLTNEAGAIVARERPELMADTPAAESRIAAFLDRRTVAEMARHPRQTLDLKARCLAYFFWPRLVPHRLSTPDTTLTLGANGQAVVEGTVPRPRWEEIAYTASYVPVLIAAVAGIWQRRRDLRRDAILWCIVVTIVAVHTVYFPATRYRVPMEFVLLFYAAVAASAAETGRSKGRAWV